MKNIGIFYDHLEYFMVIRYTCMLWPLGTFLGHLVHLSRFDLLSQEKSGNPDIRTHLRHLSAFKNKTLT
jgi:hypothetical protein